MRLALLLVLIGACGGGPSVPGGGDDDSPPSVPDGGAGGSGRMSFSWELQTGGSLGTCAEVGATQVEILTSNNSNGDERVKRFPCMSSGFGSTDLLSAGPYTVLISLLDSNQLAINNAPTQFPTITNGDVNLGVQIFGF